MDQFLNFNSLSITFPLLFQNLSFFMISGFFDAEQKYPNIKSLYQAPLIELLL